MWFYDIRGREATPSYCGKGEGVNPLVVSQRKRGQSLVRYHKEERPALRVRAAQTEAQKEVKKGSWWPGITWPIACNVISENRKRKGGEGARGTWSTW